MGLPTALNILVVDDDVHSLESIGDFLEQDGHWIRTATRGSEAVHIARDFLREKRYLQLSILDFHVPDMSGIETFKSLIALLPGMGGIFISGDNSDSMESSILAAGGFALCPKPIDLRCLRQVIEAYKKTYLL